MSPKEKAQCIWIGLILLCFTSASFIGFFHALLVFTGIAGAIFITAAFLN
jgi:hypothetical protein